MSRARSETELKLLKEALMQSGFVTPEVIWGRGVYRTNFPYTSWGNREHHYLVGADPPRYPVPAIGKHLDLIAAEPMQAWEDFKAIGYHGRSR